MAFREIVAPTLRELFVTQIIEMIFSGELHIGEKLPSERELSEQMHISRSMVHTGLEDLARMGFVRIEPRRGNYIADYARNGNFETLAAITHLRGNCLFPLILNAFGRGNTLLWEKCVRFWGVETIIEQEQHIIDLLDAGKGHEAALYLENIFRHYLEAHAPDA